MKYLTEAIKLLKPNAQFSYNSDDYSTIKWDVLEGDAPTYAEIELAAKQVAANNLKEIKDKATAKADLLVKLGITEDEAKLLLG